MVPEKELGFIKLGQDATIISAYDEKMTSKGSIQYISPVVESASGSIKIFIDLEENQNTLRAGQFVRASIKVDVKSHRRGTSEKQKEEKRKDTAHEEDDSPKFMATAIDVQVGYSDERTH